MTTIKKHIKIYRILLAVLIITLLAPTSTQASVKSDIKPLLNGMHRFVYYSMFNTIGTTSKLGKNYTIKLDNQNMLMASVLSTKFYNSKVISEKDYGDELDVIYKLSSSKLKKRCKDLFGKTASVSALQKNKEPYDPWKLYFLFQQSGHPYLYASYWETETDLIRTSLSIKKTGNATYTVKEGVYFGYWGFIQDKTAKTNYIVTYKIKKNSASSFGYVIKDMKIKRIGDSTGVSIDIQSSTQNDATTNSQVK